MKAKVLCWSGEIVAVILFLGLIFKCLVPEAKPVEEAEPVGIVTYTINGTTVKDVFNIKIVKTEKQEFKEAVYQEYQKILDDKWPQYFFNRRNDLDYVIIPLAQKSGLDPDFIRAWVYKECSMKPRKGKAGEKGYLQVLVVPKMCIRHTMRHLGVSHLDLNNPEHNLTLAAITLFFYKAELNNDMLLGLVGYNWGPNQPLLQNADDFFSVYKELPPHVKNYPTKIYAMILMQKVKDRYGKVLSYKDHQQAIELIDLPLIDY